MTSPNHIQNGHFQSDILVKKENQSEIMQMWQDALSKSNCQT